MDSPSEISGQITAYFQNDDNAQKAQEELLSIGVPSSAVVLQQLQTAKQDFLDALNRLFGSQSDRYNEGSILTVHDREHGTQILSIIERYGGDVQVRDGDEEEGSEDTESATGTQSSGNP